MQLAVTNAFALAVSEVAILTRSQTLMARSLAIRARARRAPVAQSRELLAAD